MRDDQAALCERFEVLPSYPSPDLKVGLAANVGKGIWPLNGLRHSPEGDTTGWYIWAGEVLEGRADFFLPVHVEHLDEMCPEAVPYLALPPGWRFLVAPNYEDVWYDSTLLETSN